MINKVENNILKNIIKIFIVLVLIYFGNQWYEKRYENFEKVYVVGILDKTYRVYGQGTTIDFTFEFEGDKTEASNYLGTNQIQSKTYLIEVPFKDKAKSRILWDYPVSDTLKAPFEGWPEIPEFLEKKEGD